MRVRRGVHHNELHIMGRCVVQWSNDWTTWRTLTTVTDEDMLVVFLDCAPHPHRVYAASGAGS
jgi:hypothetical protein